MKRVGASVLLVAAFLASGCADWRRPYVHDPLLRNGRGTWGDPVRGRMIEPAPLTEPDAPHPPEVVSLPALDAQAAKAK
jgi:hypothetical protein